MKYLLILILVISVSCNSSERNKIGIAIIPKPGSVVESAGFCTLGNESAIFISEFPEVGLISVFSEQVKGYLSLKSADDENADIQLVDAPDLSEEGYSLKVNKRSIIISASTSKGTNDSND